MISEAVYKLAMPFAFWVTLPDKQRGRGYQPGVIELYLQTQYGRHYFRPVAIRSKKLSKNMRH
ncbi:hypothetical protein BIZ53_18990 [Achromobacter xylosoxidans]|nr:hypothetical protein BIZ53_18990 [Achromobacter xylosoxidans]